MLSNTLYSSLFTKKSSKDTARARDLGFKVGRSERMSEQEPGPGEGGRQSCVRAHELSSVARPRELGGIGCA